MLDVEVLFGKGRTDARMGPARREGNPTGERALDSVGARRAEWADPTPPSVSRGRPPALEPTGFRAVAKLVQVHGLTAGVPTVAVPRRLSWVNALAPNSADVGHDSDGTRWARLL